MSGRVHVTHPDGHVTVGYRKTQRRNPRSPSHEPPNLRLNFILPPLLRPFISLGIHADGVDVLLDANVSIGCATFDRSRLFAMAAKFLRAITPRGLHPYSVAADMTSSSEAADFRMRWRIAYSDGHVFAAISAAEPLIFPLPA